MTRTRWIIFAAIVVLTLGGLVLFSKKDEVSVDDVNPAQIIEATEATPGDHVYGIKDSKVILFEYGDFQCPSCGGAYPQLKVIKEEYKEKIAFVFRNFPLTSIHPNALASATAAEAAGLQGKFWEMHDKLFESQNDWSEASTSNRTNIFVGYANELGLNTEQFKADFTNSKVTSKISRDRALGKKLGITGTPTIFIGDTKQADDVVADLINGKGDKLRDKLDAELKAVGVEPPKRS